MIKNMLSKLEDSMFEEIVVLQHNGKFVINGGWTFDSRTEAEAYITVRDQWYAAMNRFELFPEPMTCEQYQVATATEGVRAYSDAELMSMAYGLEYGDYSPTPKGYTVQKWFEMALASRRYQTLKTERVAAQTKRQKPQADYPQGRKLACGCIVYSKSQVMSASLGTSCPDCYDRMSD
jgi:hypothetical protein